MKKLFIISVLMTVTLCAYAQSDTDPVDAYFTTREMPDMLKWHPAPPDTIGAAFAYDIMQYMGQGDAQRQRTCRHRHP